MPIVVNENGRISGYPDNIHLRSDEVQEFISRKPNLLVRWGTALFLGVLVMLGTVCWFIQYPDLVVSRARLTSINAPKEVSTRTEGKLSGLLVANGDMVSQGSILAYIESIANPASVTLVRSDLDSIQYHISRNNVDRIVKFFPDYTRQSHLKELGELQQPFQTFMQDFTNFRNFISNGFFLRKLQMLETDLTHITRLHAILEEQQVLLEKDLVLSTRTFDANASLAKDKVISPLDYRMEESKLIAKQLTLPQIRSAIVTNEAQQNEKRKELAELKNQISVQKNNFVQALHSLISQFDQWEMKHILKAPLAGRVQMSGFYQQNQFVKNGQSLFYVQPDSTQYFMELSIPQYNFGKVVVGQDVLLKFNAYPFEQFGSVTGKVEFISPTPTDSGYLAKVALPSGLKTNYGKTLKYQYGLFAQADIVTENMRLLERFYYNIRKQIRW